MVSKDTRDNILLIIALLGGAASATTLALNLKTLAGGGGMILKNIVFCVGAGALLVLVLIQGDDPLLYTFMPIMTAACWLLVRRSTPGAGNVAWAVAAWLLVAGAATGSAASQIEGEYMSAIVLGGVAAMASVTACTQVLPAAEYLRARIRLEKA